MKLARMPPLAANVLLLLASLGISVGAVEAFLRVVYPVGAVVSGIDDRILYRLIPGARKRFIPLPGNGNSVLVRIDQRGFRGEGFTEPPLGPRVVVYGDSFVEGEFSPVEKTFVARLESELRQRLGQPHLAAINAGVAGYGPDQTALRIEREIDELRPDLIVLCLFVGNDFGDLVRNRLFRLGPTGELLDNRPVLGAEMQQVFADADRIGHQPVLVRAATNALASLRATPQPKSFPRYIDDALADHKREYVDFVENQSDVVNNLFWDRYDADVALEPDSPSARFKVALMEKILARIDDTARAHGVPWLVVAIPDPIDVAINFEIPIDLSRHPNHDPRRLTSRVVDAAEVSGIAHVNLFDTLSETGGEQLYFRFGDNHWNAAGQARAAAVVAAALSKRGWPRPAISIATR